MFIYSNRISLLSIRSFSRINSLVSLKRRTMSSNITRIDEGDRMSQIVIHNDVVYLSGQVGNPDVDGDNITKQTETTLAKVDTLLEKAGTDKSKLLQVTIWLKDMSHFAEMNAVWNNWVVAGQKPARACGQSTLAREALLVEVIATAAK